MGIDSKLIIKPKFGTHNVGFLEIWDDVEQQMIAAGFKSPAFRTRPNVKFLPTPKFEVSSGAIHGSYTVLFPVPDSKDEIPYDQRSFFFFYTDLKRSSRSNEDRESLMIKLGWFGHYKLAFFLLAYGLVDKYTVNFLDNDSYGQQVRLSKADIEAYLIEVGTDIPHPKEETS